MFCRLKTGAEVMKAYVAAQMPGVVEMGVVGERAA
mgnify:CR=1 FL=1